MSETTSTELDNLIDRYDTPGLEAETKQAIEAYVAQREKALLATISKHLPEKMVNYPDYAIDRANGYNQALTDVNKLLTTQKGSEG